MREAGGWSGISPSYNYKGPNHAGALPLNKFPCIKVLRFSALQMRMTPISGSWPQRVFFFYIYFFLFRVLIRDERLIRYAKTLTAI